MAKEIVIWCSVHIAEEVRVPGLEYEIAVNGKTRLIDLCPECRDQYLAPLEQILDEHAETPKRKYTPRKSTAAAPAPPAAAAVAASSTKYTPNEDGKFECPDPFCGRIFDTAQGLGRHRTSHASTQPA